MTFTIHDAHEPVTPLVGSAKRSLIVTSRIVGKALPRAVAEALADAGIEADITIARQRPQDLSPTDLAFRVRKPAPPKPIKVALPGVPGLTTMTIEQASRLHEDLTRMLVERDRATRWAASEADLSAKAEQYALPALRVGVRVRRTIRNQRSAPSLQDRDGGIGWQYEPGAAGIVSGLVSDGRILVRVDGDGGVRTWRKGSFVVIG